MLTSVLIACPNYIKKNSPSQQGPLGALEERASTRRKNKKQKHSGVSGGKASLIKLVNEKALKSLRRPERIPNTSHAHLRKKKYVRLVPGPSFFFCLPSPNPRLTGSRIRPASGAPRGWQVLRETRIIRPLQKRTKDGNDKEAVGRGRGRNKSAAIPPPRTFTDCSRDKHHHGPRCDVHNESSPGRQRRRVFAGGGETRKCGGE